MLMNVRSAMVAADRGATTKMVAFTAPVMIAILKQTTALVSVSFLLFNASIIIVQSWMSESLAKFACCLLKIDRIVLRRPGYNRWYK